MAGGSKGYYAELESGPSKSPAAKVGKKDIKKPSHKGKGRRSSRKA